MALCIAASTISRAYFRNGRFIRETGEAKRNSSLGRGNTAIKRRIRSVSLAIFLSIVVYKAGWVPAVALACARQCDCTTRRCAAAKANTAFVDGGSFQRRQMPVLSRSLLRVTVVRVIRSPLTHKHVGENIRDEQSKLEMGGHPCENEERCAQARCWTENETSGRIALSTFSLL